MNLLEGMSEIGSKLSEFISDFIDMVKTSYEALQTFYNMLNDFDERVVNMVDNCGTSEFGGLPVIKAIATYHYVVGDVVFYLMYMVTLLGCLFTIYKILILLYGSLKSLISLFKSYFSTSSIASLASFLK